MHRQLAAAALGASVEAIELGQSDTDLVAHDTGAYGSTGTVVAGPGHAAGRPGARRALAARAARGRAAAQAEGAADGTPRSVSFNVQGFRVAVGPATGEIRILHSVQAVDAGTVINPMQCRGQVEGGVAQALGAALYEHVDIDAAGQVTTRTLREYHVPAVRATCRDTEVFFADTNDPLGPLGAKPMSEAPVQSGGPGAGQRYPGRHRRAVDRAAVHPRPGLHRLALPTGALRWNDRGRRKA